MNDNEETRSYTEIEQELRRALAANTMLQTQVAQMRQTIAGYERADAVAQAIAANNDKLRSEPEIENRLIARARRWHGK